MADGVQWLETEDQFDLGYWAVFARDLDPVELVRRLGPVTPVGGPVTRFEVDAVEAQFDGIAVRAGGSAGWAYGVVENGPVRRGPDAAVCSLSIGTVAVEWWCTVNRDMRFAFAEDGQVVCEFEPGAEHERSGADPDRLLPALQRAGLVLPDGRTPFEHGIDIDRPLLRVLALAESEFGVDLPRGAVLHSALTAGVLSEWNQTSSS
ncbi:DUF6461 domain-containing protein [Streptacidiphilus sp. N1-12]|uniref:DUF6461 domain-containing protein n=2 Tax=Streptacidiphilus alkalitolerans TaxID=3342712 RepID=A0ABV6WLZ3_9ACTN